MESGLGFVLGQAVNFHLLFHIPFFNIQSCMKCWAVDLILGEVTKSREFKKNHVKYVFLNLVLFLNAVLTKAFK